VHYAPDEIISLPSTVITLPKSKTGGATISYCPLKNSNLGIWLFGLPYTRLNNKTAAAKREAIRNNTIAILRYWSELQAAVAVRNVVLSNAFGFSKKGQDLLERYLKEINSFLFSAKWHGAPMDMIRNIMDAYQSAIPGNFQDIENAMKAFRRQVGANFMKIGLRKPGIFVSYSHLDAEFLDDIREAINIHYQTQQITYFDDTFIKPGEEWDPKIKNALENATIAVLLVSENFLKSEYIQTIEQKKLVDLNQRQKTKIISLLLSGKVPEKGSLSNLLFINGNQPFTTCTPEEKQNILALLQAALKS
jgi:TIR domain